ncbi:hypothetical protein DTO164E3_6233 [Paecilomyces variotii]|nr:hypothetical protein DTO032I3_6583 [Paecilomyces variotii]KAJ9196433.1 hypothetical protein DTO164E3_6233 [Paecilomyces variotii]KAJ9244672.1 hypothetical protein DTO169E5_1493 [Paecilomyces variotii]KAJ9257091.1 hypothetical protein DTO207G8_2263 [Paecilomyces variotii]KAJ9261409.1 hypothetical protein DTO195F2_4205 [Paecilomyces variotii]
MSNQGYYSKRYQKSDPKGQLLLSGMTRHSSPPFLLCESPTSQADAEESLRRHETNSSSAQEKKLEDPRGTRVEPTPTSDTQAHGAYTGSSQRSTQQHDEAPISGIAVHVAQAPGRNHLSMPNVPNANTRHAATVW